ncbi:uncharacterized protein [Oscarella lobularis]
MMQALATLFSVLIFLSPLHIGSVSCLSDPCVSRNPDEFSHFNPSSGIVWQNTPYDFFVQAGSVSGYRVGFIKAAKSGAALTYEISSDPQNVLFVDPATGELTLKNDIDERYSSLGTDQFCASSRAHSGPSQSQIGVALYRDSNKMTPTFINSSYNFVLPEDLSLGTVIFFFNASDTDSGEDGRVTYIKVGGSADATFSLNDTTGELSLEQRLDYETATSIAFQIFAEDHGRFPRTGTATIYVRVTDVNDNPPYFEPDKYSASLLENATVGSYVLNMSAIDRDTPLADLRYSLQTSYQEFFINRSTGVLVLSGSLDYERRTSYTLKVIVSDSKFSSEAEVIITVQNVDECYLAVCYNGGTCVDGDGLNSCFCAPGFTNERCQTNIDECTSHPCQNNGTCSEGIAMYNCSCVDGYTGTHCEINYDECSSEPCLHDSTCIDGVNSYQCLCKSGYTGAHCGVDVDECQSSPCQNGGTCTDIVNGYWCSCSNDFCGGNCDFEFQSVGEVNRNYLLISFLCFLAGLLIGMVILYLIMKKRLVSLERRLKKTQSNDDMKMTMAPGFGNILHQVTTDLPPEIMYENNGVPQNNNIKMTLAPGYGNVLREVTDDLSEDLYENIE